MEDDLIFYKIEDNLNFLKMEGDLIYFLNGTQRNFFFKWKKSVIFSSIGR